MKKQNKATVLFRMVKLVKPLTGFMLAAILMGGWVTMVTGFLS